MRVNEAGDMFMIDWAYNGYCFAIYGKSPQDTSDRDMAAVLSNHPLPTDAMGKFVARSNQIMMLLAK